MAHVEGGVLTIVIRAADVVAPRPDPAVESIAIITIYQLSHPSGLRAGMQIELIACAGRSTSPRKPLLSSTLLVRPEISLV